MIDFIKPLQPELISFVDTLSKQQLGAKIQLHTKESFPDLQNIQIAILGVAECRGAGADTDTDIQLFRKEFYKLYAGNWDCSMVDLGDLNKGEALSDTYFALKEITLALLKKNIVLVVMGGTQDLNYPLYRAYDGLDKMVNLACVDNKFDFGRLDLSLSSDSYLAKIIMDQPNNLHNYSNIGYQTYFTPQEEIDLIEKMFFDAYRLGEVGADIGLAEPVLRDADLVSIDLSAVSSAYTGNFSSFTPNGFSGKEICAISRYAGISDRVSVFGIFNSEGNLRSEAVLQAQILWYFIEGYTCRYNEYPFISHQNATKYTVHFEDETDLIFYKSENSQRWWMEIPFDIDVKNKTNNFTLLPCSYREYQEALKGNFPERWWKEQKKLHSVQ